jgi:hypothetical protein
MPCGNPFSQPRGEGHHVAAVSGLVRADADGCLVCHAASLPCDVRWKKHIWLLLLLRVGRGRVHLPGELPARACQDFALDPLIAPAAVLGGELLDQRGDLRADRRSAGPVRIGTATSCRSTSSSASLDAAERLSRNSQPHSRTKIR